jgi:hypothetical protein
LLFVRLPLTPFRSYPSRGHQTLLECLSYRKFGDHPAT